MGFVCNALITAPTASPIKTKPNARIASWAFTCRLALPARPVLPPAPSATAALPALNALVYLVITLPLTCVSDAPICVCSAMNLAVLSVRIIIGLMRLESVLLVPRAVWSVNSMGVCFVTLSTTWKTVHVWSVLTPAWRANR